MLFLENQRRFEGEKTSNSQVFQYNSYNKTRIDEVTEAEL
ncbi:hypothetical protein VCR15J2_470495 [Vibrio coralliirubri]|nr:hypothetical protein VCR15J2_470495 [Vibrio coralliirubri]